MMSDYHKKQGDHKELKEILDFFSFLSAGRTFPLN